jgi:hypothetical protein
MKKQRRLVVAKYKEDISWINELKDHFDIVVYNKDNNLDPHDLNFHKREYHIDGIKWIDLPNIGREAQTYLFHIIENFDNLHDLEVFTQGNPFDHTPHFIQSLINLNPSDYYKNLCNERATQIRSDFINCESNLVYFYYGTVNTLHREIFKKDVPEKYEIGIRGMFSVNRNAITDNSIEVYKKCYSKFDTKEYLVGFNYLEKVAGREVNMNEYESVISQYGGIPNGENFPYVFEYFWDLLFKSSKVLA